jgi:hypothetical protein
MKQGRQGWLAEAGRAGAVSWRLAVQVRQERTLNAGAVELPLHVLVDPLKLQAGRQEGAAGVSGGKGQQPAKALGKQPSRGGVEAGQGSRHTAAGRQAGRQARKQVEGHPGAAVPGCVALLGLHPPAPQPSAHPAAAHPSTLHGAAVRARPGLVGRRLAAIAARLNDK